MTRHERRVPVRMVNRQDRDDEIVRDIEDENFDELEDEDFDEEERDQERDKKEGDEPGYEVGPDAGPTHEIGSEGGTTGTLLRAPLRDLTGGSEATETAQPRPSRSRDRESGG